MCRQSSEQLGRANLFWATCTTSLTYIQLAWQVVEKLKKLQADWGKQIKAATKKPKDILLRCSDASSVDGCRKLEFLVWSGNLIVECAIAIRDLSSGDRIANTCVVDMPIIGVRC